MASAKSVMSAMGRTAQARDRPLLVAFHQGIGLSQTDKVSSYVVTSCISLVRRVSSGAAMTSHVGGGQGRDAQATTSVGLHETRSSMDGPNPDYGVPVFTRP